MEGRKGPGFDHQCTGIVHTLCRVGADLFSNNLLSLATDNRAGPHGGAKIGLDGRSIKTWRA